MKTLSPLNQQRLKLRSVVKDENMAQRLCRRIRKRVKFFSMAAHKVDGQSIAIEIRFKDAEGGWTGRRLIGVWSYGGYRPRVVGVNGQGVNGAPSDPDVQADAAMLAREHADNLALARDLRRIGHKASARACIARATRIRLCLPPPATEQPQPLLLEAAE